MQHPCFNNVPIHFNNFYGRKIFPQKYDRSIKFITYCNPVISTKIYVLKYTQKKQMYQRVHSRELNCQGMKMVFQMYDDCLLCYLWFSASVVHREVGDTHARTHTHARACTDSRAHSHARAHAHAHTHTHTLSLSLSLTLSLSLSLYQKSGKEAKLRNLAKM